MRSGTSSVQLVFTHRATAGNISENSTYIDTSCLNNNHQAIIVVTPNWNPDGPVGKYSTHPTGVWYDTRTNRWAIFNQDLALMEAGLAFNVCVACFIVVPASMDPLPVDAATPKLIQ